MEDMRIDKFLKITRLIKRRTVATKACKDGNVFINEKIAKPGTKIAIGDIIRIEFGENIVNVKVIDINGHIKKEDVSNLIEYI
jgi:ribosomal 50S subunit-recycling heat shock protein